MTLNIVEISVVQEPVTVQDIPQVSVVGADTGTVFLHRLDEPANFYHFS